MLKNKIRKGNKVFATYINRKLCKQNFDAVYDYDKHELTIENEHLTIKLRSFEDYECWGSYGYREMIKENKEILVNIIQARNVLAFYY